MKRTSSIVIALALVACKKDAPRPAEPEHVAEDDVPALEAELTCEEVAQNPVIAREPGLARKFLEYCAEHPGEISQALLRCARDARSLDALDYCEDEAQEEPKPQRSEAEVKLDMLKKGAKAYYIENAGFPGGSVPLTPVDPCCASGRTDRKCEVDLAQWTSGDPDRPLLWDELYFELDEPHFFQYAYESTATGFVATAVGDLDCDDTAMTYTLEANLGADGPTYTLTKPARAD